MELGVGWVQELGSGVPWMGAGSAWGVEGGCLGVGEWVWMKEAGGTGWVFGVGGVLGAGDGVGEWGGGCGMGA